jgi:hypothetical protein
MALLTCHVESEALEVATTFTAFLPQGSANPPVLYLLHGLADDHTDGRGTRRSSGTPTRPDWPS